MSRRIEWKHEVLKACSDVSASPKSTRIKASVASIRQGRNACLAILATPYFNLQVEPSNIDVERENGRIVDSSGERLTTCRALFI